MTGDLSRLRRGAVLGPVLAMLCLMSETGQLTAAQKNPLKWFGGDKDVSYKIFRDSAGRFEVEYPDKGWRILPNVGASLAVFSHDDGPALFIDHVTLTEPLTPGEIDVLPDVEVDRLKKLERQVKDFTSDTLDTKSGRGVLVKYSQVGAEPKSVLQLTIAVGLELFRLNAVVPGRLLSKYEPIIMHAIQSFKAPASAPSPKR
jgi:hypothetical protein